MKTTIGIACALACAALALGGCEKASGTPKDDNAPKPGDVSMMRSNPAPVVTMSEPNATPNADDTKKNERDRDSNAVTPFSQGNSKEDIDISAEIRRRVVHDGMLGTDAKNVKIITNGGVVTLRGPVASEAERKDIVAHARATTGVVDVQDQLEINDNKK